MRHRSMSIRNTPRLNLFHTAIHFVSSNEAIYDCQLMPKFGGFITTYGY